MSKKKSQNNLGTCRCLACRLQSAIIAELAPDGAEEFHIDAGEALSALAPTLSMFLAGLEYRDTEAYWMDVLNERARFITPEGTDFGENFKGRA